MTDEQIAYQYLLDINILTNQCEALSTLIAIIGEARSTERARCLSIAGQYATYDNPGPVQQAAGDIWDAINEG